MQYSKGATVWYDNKWQTVLLRVSPKTVNLVTHCRLELIGPLYTLYLLTDNEKQSYAWENWIDKEQEKKRKTTN